MEYRMVETKSQDRMREPAPNGARNGAAVELTDEQKQALERGLRILARMIARAYLREQASVATATRSVTDGVELERDGGAE